MKAKEILKQGKHTSKKFFIIYILCVLIIVFSTISINERIENEKPNATDFTQNGAVGTEAGKYVYLQVDGLSDSIATYVYDENQNSTENDKYYIAINGYDWYLVNLSDTYLEQLKNIQSYTYGEIENKPASVTIYGITEEVPDELKEIAIDFYNQEIEEDKKITIEQFDNYFGSVLLNTKKDPVDTTIETLAITISFIILFITVIMQFFNKIVRLKVMKYLEKNNYKDELEKQLDDNIEETFFNERLIITKDYLVDITKGAFSAVRFSDIKWIYTHRLKYYGIFSISNNIIILLKDGKTQFQCLDTKGGISKEFEQAFEKICTKLSDNSLKGYIPENIKEFKDYKKELKKQK